MKQASPINYENANIFLQLYFELYKLISWNKCRL